MGSFSLTHWLIVAVVVLILFGRGKVSDTMGEFGKGIRNFRRGMSEGENREEAEAASTSPQINQSAAQVGNTLNASQDKSAS